MWIYRQATGSLERVEGGGYRVVGVGYAGHGVGKNDPLSQHIKGIGPLPVGAYWISEPFDSPHTGKFVMRLIPVTPGVELYDRNSFEMHGENAAHPGESSDGCIVQDHAARQEVADKRDLLIVLPS